jgi:multiple sugar transport system substrate-binding protein
MNVAKVRLVLFSILLVLLLSLVGVAGAQDVTEVQMTWWGGDTRHNRTIEVIEMYEAANPNVDIVYEFASFSDYWTLLNTKAAGGQLPCIMQQDYAYLAEWQSRDLLTALDPYYESGVLDVSNVPTALLEGGKVGDQYYGLSLGTNSQSFILDVDAFEQAGVELPAQDWTWADFEQIATALHEQLGIWGMTMGSSGLDDVQIWRSVNLGYGQPAISPDGMSIGYTDDQPTIDHFNMILRLQEAGVIAAPDEAAEFAGIAPEETPIAKGLAAMQYQWSNQVIAILNAAGDRTLKLWHLPRPEGGQPSNYLKPSMFFSIPSQCEHPEIAADFISFFTNDLAANEVLAAERGVPIATPVLEHLQTQVTPAVAETFDFISRVTEDSSPIPDADPPNWSNFINNVYGPLFAQPVLFGELSVEEGVVLLREEGNKVLSGEV